MFDTCRFCDNAVDAFDNGEMVTLAFESGNQYTMPVNLPHMVSEHMYSAPTQLVGDVMLGRFLPNGSPHAYAAPVIIEVSNNFPIGPVPLAFPLRLREFIQIALTTKH